jgi:sugar O-acyltransferase (sialic acid O-acetyltransferase NeuD family)
MLAVYGAGGFALQILGLVEAAAKAGEPVCLVDDQRAGETLFGWDVVRLEDVAPDAEFAIAVATPAHRQSIAARVSRFRELRAATALVSPHASIAEGAILCDYAIVEAGARIGRHFHGNIFSYVAHESVIGDFVTFAPRVNCNGRVTIGDGAYVGTGAFLKQGVSIGAGATVGMGSVVIQDVPAGATVVGNPARIMRRSDGC